MPAPTIKDVARRAAVSTATVSRVLNRTGLVDADTERRVLDAVEALDYRRNVNWERLSRRAARMVCFLLGNRAMPNSMHVRMLMAAERALTQAGYDLVFAGFRYQEDTSVARLELPRLLQSRGVVDGVLLGGIHYQNLLDALDRLPIPSVLLGNTCFVSKARLHTDAVLYDDVSAVEEATRYLTRMGHERIAFIGDISMPWFARRHRGYLRAVRAARLRPMETTAPWDLDNVGYGLRAMQAMLRGKVRPTAVVAGNDEVAGGVWKALMARGLAVPSDVSLVGFGDRQEVAFLEPSLTTITSFPDVLGAEAARMLLEKLRAPGAALPARTFPCQLIERASCAPPAAAAARMSVLRPA
jgi:DNA-binding LacI/PurR family transcriptional regulator